MSHRGANSFHCVLLAEPDGALCYRSCAIVFDRAAEFLLAHFHGRDLKCLSKISFTCGYQAYVQMETSDQPEFKLQKKLLGPSLWAHSWSLTFAPAGFADSASSEVLVPPYMSMVAGGCPVRTAESFEPRDVGENRFRSENEIPVSDGSSRQCRPPFMALAMGFMSNPSRPLLTICTTA